jgi:hypothetical protein
MMLAEELLQGFDEGRVDGASCRMWAAEKVIFVFVKVAACRCAGRRRSQLHAVLTGLEGEDVIHPLDQEEAVRKAGFLVGDRIENVPIDLVELGVRPVMDPAKVLELGLVVGVWQ